MPCAKFDKSPLSLLPYRGSLANIWGWGEPRLQGQCSGFSSLKWSWYSPPLVGQGPHTDSPPWPGSKGESDQLYQSTHRSWLPFGLEQGVTERKGDTDQPQSLLAHTTVRKAFPISFRSFWVTPEQCPPTFAWVILPGTVSPAWYYLIFWTKMEAGRGRCSWSGVQQQTQGVTWAGAWLVWDTGSHRNCSSQCLPSQDGIWRCIQAGILVCFWRQWLVFRAEWLEPCHSVAHLQGFLSKLMINQMLPHIMVYILDHRSISGDFSEELNKNILNTEEN